MFIMISNCAIFRNNENNNFGVILPNGNIVLKEMFDDIMYSVADWAIVSVRFSKYMHSDLIYYGIIDKNMHIVIDPLSIRKFYDKLCKRILIIIYKNG